MSEIDRNKIKEGLAELLRYETEHTKNYLNNLWMGDNYPRNFYKRVRDVAMGFLDEKTLKNLDEAFRESTRNNPEKDYLVIPHNSENSLDE